MTENKVSIIIPAYNESATIGILLEKVTSIELSVDKEIIVVDDGSTDGTPEIVKHFKDVRLIENEKNMGKGYSLKRGYLESSGNIILFQDADLEYNPSQIKNLVDAILEGRSDVVYGSRFKGNIKNISLTNRIGNKILTAVTNVLFNSRLTDMETCYKAFRRDVLEFDKLDSDRFEIEAEITARILKNGHRIIEVPIDYSARTGKEGKKITVMDGLRTCVMLFKERFN